MTEQLIKYGKRRCWKCKLVFPLSREYFYGDKRKAARLTYMCHKCQSEETEKWRKKHFTKSQLINYGKRKCYRCKQIFPLSKKFFCITKREAAGLGYVCRKCQKERIIEWTREYFNRETKPQLIKQNKRRCHRCKSVFPLSKEFFNSSRNSAAGLQYMCRKCQSETVKKRWRKYPEERYSQRQEYFYLKKIAEKKLGRKLKSGETIHHIDGNERNNFPENLYIFHSRSAHSNYEWNLRITYVKWIRAEFKNETNIKICHKSS